MQLFYITNDFYEAQICEQVGIDWVFLDLEIIGKEDRQAKRDTVISLHSLNDIPPLKSVLKKTKLLVRINPFGTWTRNEVVNCDELGADMIMLPYFTRVEEVMSFLNIPTKAQKCLLLETMDSVYKIDDILSQKGIDYIHVGLNDLSIERGTNFLFEFLADGWLEILSEKFNNANIQWGFGGIGPLNELSPTGSELLKEHSRLNSGGVILSRSFKRDCIINDRLSHNLLAKKIGELRREVVKNLSLDEYEILKNRELVVNKIKRVSQNL